MLGQEALPAVDGGGQASRGALPRHDAKSAAESGGVRWEWSERPGRVYRMWDTHRNIFLAMKALHEGQERLKSQQFSEDYKSSASK